ncbi:MAG: hypothetical protein IT210_22305 [Armatimonadetes bacterium]|nr:hypothetical protein [Armatimonadota bacterium]
MTSGGIDNRQVVLLKSRFTNNRFYTLVSPESGLKNADTIEDFPEHLPLGIAYPCLEDGLNDFAVIRTTFETLEQFPDDQELRDEMMEIIYDASSNLRKRLIELRDRLASGQAHFLGTDLDELKDYMIAMIRKGSPRKMLDSMMKLDVFGSVEEADASRNGGHPEPNFNYSLLSEHALERIEPMPARPFVVEIFQDVLDAVNNEDNYLDRYTFDKYVFQKFIAIMFINYATTDPIFYGTSKADYGVSADRDMSTTPLYIAIGEALRAIETDQAPVHAKEREPGVDLLKDGLPATTARVVEISGIPASEQQLLAPITTIFDTCQVLMRMDHPRTREYSEIIVRAVSQIVRELKELSILSPMAEVPGTKALSDKEARS